MRSASVTFAVLVVAITAAFSIEDREPNGGMDGATDIASPDTVVEASSRETRSDDLWQRPDGPLRVALQAGHWRSAEAPDEQSGLRGNGTRGGGKQEWEVNLEIANQAARMLEEAGYVVEVLPTTIPPGYWADVFVSIHADGNPNSNVSGFRAAAPRRDATGFAQEFADLLEQTYGDATGLRHYPTVIRRMRGYYAFNSRRYQHALHPMTVGVILETGFLTSPSDRRVIVDDPARAARGIADAVTLYLESNRPQPRIAGVR